MNTELFKNAIAEIVEAGSKVASAATRLTNAKATLGQRIAFTIASMDGDIDERIAKIRAELGKSDKEGAKRASSALNASRPLIPFALSRVDAGESFDGIKWPTVSLANAVLRGAGLEPSTTDGEQWATAYKDATEDVAEEVALAWAEANGKGPVPVSLVEKKIETAYKQSRPQGSSSEMTIPSVIEWAEKLAPEALETLIEGLLKIRA